jgi:peroxiredoxin
MVHDAWTDPVRHHGQLSGQTITGRTLRDIHDHPVRIPDSERIVHLQFRRYAGCPVCNVHLRTFAVRHDDLLACGIKEVVVFHSEAQVMKEFQSSLPFPAVADPGQVLYAEFGVRTMSITAALNPPSWRAAAYAPSHSPSLRGAIGKGEQHMGLPADFLIDRDGIVIAAHYGKVVDDHWSVDEVLRLATAS